LKTYYEDEKVVFRQCFMKLNHGNNYHFGDFLVVTPLTEKCYLSAMSALHQNETLFCAGPAGTGKTETARDFANKTGYSLVVI